MSLYEYRPRSMLAEHKRLAIAFAIIVLASAFYLLKPRHDKPAAAPPAQSVYVEMLPGKTPNP
jgi:hypothetical protein